MTRATRLQPAERDVDYCALIAAPFGRMGIRTRDQQLVDVVYLPPEGGTWAAKNALAREVCRQLEAYLADARHRFDLPCAPEGTAFQQRVWREIARIESGSTRTYGELAQRLGSAPRPVGGACGSNPIPLIIPCHRVVAAGGGLGGFMHSRATWTLAIKRWLLRHEGC